MQQCRDLERLAASTGESTLQDRNGKPDFSGHARTLFDFAISFIDTPRKFWPFVQRLYRWVLRSGGGPFRYIAHYNLARLLHEEGKYEKAAKHYRQAIDLKKDYYKAYNNLGIVLCLMGRYEESECAFRRALKITDYVNARNNLADLYLRVGRLKEARAEVLVALKMQPDFVLSTLTYAQILSAMGRYSQAEEQYRRALALDSTNIELLTNYAEFLSHRGKPEEANEISTKAQCLVATQKQDNRGLQEWREQSKKYIEQRKGGRTDVG